MSVNPTSVYPGAQDSFTQPVGSMTLGFYPHSAIEQAQNNALSAIEGYLGVTGSVVASTVSYGLYNSGSISPGHRHVFSDINGVLPVSAGGTGQTSTTGTLNSILPSQTGNGGFFLQTDGTNASWESVNNNTTLASGVASIFDDFVGGVNNSVSNTIASSGIGDLGWVSNAGVVITGGGISASDSINHPGVIKFGTNNSNALGIYLANVIGDLTAPNSSYLGIVNLSSTAGAFGFGISNGFLTNAGIGSTPYLMIRATGGAWQGVYCNGSSETIAGSSVLVTGWSRLLITVNASGTSASFNIGSTSLGTAGISASNQQMNPFFSNLGQHIVSSNPAYSVDYFGMYRQITR